MNWVPAPGWRALIGLTELTLSPHNLDETKIGGAARFLIGRMSLNFSLRHNSLTNDWRRCRERAFCPPRLLTCAWLERAPIMPEAGALEMNLTRIQQLGALGLIALLLALALYRWLHLPQ